MKYVRNSIPYPAGEVHLFGEDRLQVSQLLISWHLGDEEINRVTVHEVFDSEAIESLGEHPQVVCVGEDYPDWLREHLDSFFYFGPRSLHVSDKYIFLEELREELFTEISAMLPEDSPVKAKLDYVLALTS